MGREELIKQDERAEEVYKKLKEADGLAECYGIIESLTEYEAKRIIELFVYEYAGFKKRNKERL